MDWPTYEMHEIECPTNKNNFTVVPFQTCVSFYFYMTLND